MAKKDFFNSDRLQREFNVNETLRVLKHNISIFWSWGVHNLTSCKNKALTFNVNGMKFKGVVAITLNWNDTYRVTFLSSKWNVKDEIEEVYFDELVEKIDEKIEKQPNYKF